MKPYRYEPLRENEIRLVTIPPRSQGNTEISIEAVNISLDYFESFAEFSDQDSLPCDSFRPRYEALSYAWGSTERMKYIEVQASPEDAAESHAYIAATIAWQKFSRNSRHSSFMAPRPNARSLAVTHNLAQALPYLQLANRPRVLWIDALCINQQNLAEKGEQVKKMASIYKSATSVVVWLGPSTKQLVTGLKVIAHLASMVEVDFAARQMRPASGQDSSWANSAVELPYDDETRSAMSMVFECCWFERLWIWQEVNAQPRRSSLLCGSSYLEWEEFRKAMFCVESKLAGDADNGRGFDPKRFAMIAHLCRSSGVLGLDQFLYLTERAKCSDPRDRIYSLLALRRSGEQFAIEPDYTGHYSKVYRDATVGHIAASGTLSLLKMCKLHDCPGNLPSWVRDWSSPGRQNTLGGAPASLFSNAEAFFIWDSVLEVGGVEVATIEKVDRTNGIFGNFRLTSEEFFRELFKLSPDGRYSMKSVLRTLTCNSFSDAWFPDNENFSRIEDLELSIRRRSDYADSVQDSANPIADSELTKVARILTPSERLFKSVVDGYKIGRALITTSDGQIGLGPADAAIGDSVCVLLGCPNPLVLRPVSCNSWLVIGPSYIEELAYGEAFYGPLPGNIRLVCRAIKAGIYPGFLDPELRNITPRDPRAGPLPHGWELQEHRYQDIKEWYYNTESGEVTAFDPRLTSKELRKRGVPMRTFKLV